MGGQRSTFRGSMVLDLGGQWSGANGLGGLSSIYQSMDLTACQEPAAGKLQ